MTVNIVWRSDGYPIKGSEWNAQLAAKPVADLEFDSDKMVEVQKESVESMSDDVQRWAKSKGGTRFWTASATEDILPAGKYHCGHSADIGFYFEKQDIKTDDLLELPDDSMQEVFEQFNDFWKREARFRERGILFKRGYLFYGEPGSGKSSAVQILIKRVINDLNGIVVVCDHPAMLASCMALLRRFEPRRPALCIIEDIDNLIEKYSESDFLSLLDGESQIDNVIYLATSNYPGRLPPRLIDRPSRFDIVREVSMPSPKAREVYLRAKEKSLSDSEIKEWVELSDGFSIAHLKEMITGVKVFDQNIRDVVARLRAMGVQELPTESKKRGKKQVGMIPLTPVKKNGGFKAPIPQRVSGADNDGDNY